MANATVLSTVALGSTLDFDRVVLVEDATFRIVSQLVINESSRNSDDGDPIDGWNGYPDGDYWMFVGIREGLGIDSSIGWVFLPAQAGGHCEQAAG